MNALIPLSEFTPLLVALNVQSIVHMAYTVHETTHLFQETFQLLIALSRPTPDVNLWEDLIRTQLRPLRDISVGPFTPTVFPECAMYPRFVELLMIKLIIENNLFAYELFIPEDRRMRIRDAMLTHLPPDMIPAIDSFLDADFIARVNLQLSRRDTRGKDDDLEVFKADPQFNRLIGELV